MGDILHALPAVTALRQAHPTWIIDWVVEPRWQALLSASAAADLPSGLAQPLVDHLHFAATKEWRKSLFSRHTLSQIIHLRQSLHAGRYDAVLDLQGAIRSAILAQLSGCQRIIGEAEPRERAARWLFTATVATRGAHVIQQDIELAASIAGDDLLPCHPWLPVDSAAELWAETVLPLDSPQSSILINPGAGWGAKRWPVERYAEVAQQLIQRGCRVLVNAGPGEQPMADAIVRQTSGAATALSCSLAQLIALTRRVSLAIAGDTGPLHLACALGRPVVGIYGPTDPSRNGPFGTQFKVLRSPISQRDHTRRPDPEAGLLTIQPADVLRAADELLYPVTATHEKSL
jgi:heptosyltransferase-1